MYPDIRHATVAGKSAPSLVSADWIKDEFTPRVQKRGAEIIQLRKLSSAASAGNASIDHLKDWEFGSQQWQSIGVKTDGTQYGVPKDLIFSFPCTTSGGKIHVVEGI